MKTLCKKYKIIISLFQFTRQKSLELKIFIAIVIPLTLLVSFKYLYYDTWGKYRNDINIILVKEKQSYNINLITR
jgi:hypothetical protein